MHKQVLSPHSKDNSEPSDFDDSSLTDEILPTFKLRANNSGYEEENWIGTPVLSPDENVALSPEQCEETFKLFLLSGVRLSQMTRTYHDIDAVMHLLKEKERDLELAARIGQTLLSKNKEVEHQNEFLQEKLTSAIEEASQLRHELNKKQQLLHFYTELELESDECGLDEKNTSADLHTLHSKIERLEQDKCDLIEERSLVFSQSSKIQEKENQLVSDTVQQLSALQHDLQCANAQIVAVTDELTRRNKEANKQQDDVSLLLEQISELQKKHKNLMIEHESLQQYLSQANQSHSTLSVEVQQLETRYHEVLNMLDETREEMRLFRDSSTHSDSEASDIASWPNWHIPFQQSLAAELALSEKSVSFKDDLEISSIQSEELNPTRNSVPMLSSGPTKLEKGILRTAQYANRHKLHLSPIMHSQPVMQSVSQQSLTFPRKPHFTIGSPTTITLPSPGMGQPGVPGTADLERAIEKLAQVGKESLKFVQQTRRDILKGETGPLSSYLKKCTSTPKLRIVKPLEGSLTLHNWKSLADADQSTPISALISCPTHSPGVIMRGSISSDKIGEHSNLSKSFEHLNLGKKYLKTSTDSATSSFSRFFQPAKGDSGAMATAAAPIAVALNTCSEDKHLSNPSVKKQQSAMKSVKSSPHLFSLTAALAPPRHGVDKSIMHAVFSNRNMATSAVDLAQLHGSNHDKTETKN